MIIKYPTALYKTVLPDSPSDSGNVTYVVSNTAPPRADLIFPKIPTGILSRQRLKSPVRDDHNNIPVFTVTSSDKSRASMGNGLFDIGQILEFQDNTNASIEPMLVQNKNISAHAVNISDYDSLDITNEEAELIKASAKKKFDQLNRELNSLIELRKNSESEIRGIQKLINASNNKLSALALLDQDDDLDLIKTRLINKIEDLENQKRDQIVIANDSAADAAVINGKINSLLAVID